MTYALVQAFALSSGGSAATTKTYTMAPTAGHGVMLAVSYQNANTVNITAIKDQASNNLTYTVTNTAHDNPSFGSAALVWLPNVGSGITSITITVDTSTILGVRGFEYSGLWTTNSGAGTASSSTLTATLATDNLSQAITPTQQPAMLFSYAMDLTHNSGPNAGTGFTSRAIDAATLSFGTATYRVQDKRITSTSATNSTFTNVSTSGDQFIVLTVVIPEPPPAPVLSLPTPSGTLATSSTATPGATTDTGSGTGYCVVTTTSLSGVTAAQVKAGQNAAGSTTGVFNSNGAISASGVFTCPTVSGLTASTLYNYAVVQNSAGGDSNVVTGTFTTHSPVPTISSVSPNPYVDGSSATITGTTFGASKGTGHADVAAVAQTTTAWGDTSITETVAIGANAYGVVVSQTVTNNAGDSSSGYSISINPPTGWSYVNLGTPNTTAAWRITAVSDLVSGNQLAWDTKGGLVTVNADASFVADPSVASFNVKAWDSASGWGTVGTQQLNAPPGGYSCIVIS
jgi:hypothetical protein